ncbi:JAB domain-containing protein [Peribacillus simplex]|nr:JAB domain-containing protein [Peribacillus simplex]MDW7617479.1 JAB domain-containing protein [Peribacillus simplex]
MKWYELSRKSGKWLSRFRPFKFAIQKTRELAAAQIANEDREVFLVMMLNTKNHVVGLHRAHVGSLNASVVHPRDVLKCAILNNAASLIVSHRVTQPRVWKTLKSQSDWRKQGKLLGLKF